MAKAYLNIHLQVTDDGLVARKASIDRTPAGKLGTERNDCFWASVMECESKDFDAARLEIEFTLDRGDYRQIKGLMFLKELTERSLGRPIGDGTIQELIPPGTGPFAKLFVRGGGEPDRGRLTGP